MVRRMPIGLAAALAALWSFSAYAQTATPKPAAKPAAKPDAAAPATTAPDTRDPGLYWTFQTDMGNIDCKLFEKESPITVGKMVGLAVGKISYIDPKTHATMKKRFFDGLTFHRVIPNFMIQGGDPLGDGTGSPEGPGFPYKNERTPGLDFDVPGRLAMANSGPDTNASQFFVTEVANPSLNGNYTIWGQCQNGDVVKAIARVKTNSENKPNTPVHIKKVVIERVGPVPPNAPESMPSVRKPATPAKPTAKPSSTGTKPSSTGTKPPAKSAAKPAQ
jgi:peptidyl-prolyl cis-trans isomerase A (cyclophilin A)